MVSSGCNSSELSSDQNSSCLLIMPVWDTPVAVTVKVVAVGEDLVTLIVAAMPRPDFQRDDRSTPRTHAVCRWPRGISVCRQIAGLSGRARGAFRMRSDMTTPDHLPRLSPALCDLADHATCWRSFANRVGWPGALNRPLEWNRASGTIIPISPVADATPGRATAARTLKAPA